MNQPNLTTLKLEIEGAIATVYLDRPGKANAMNAPMWQDLQDCFEWLGAEPSVRVIILAANGKHFCSGIDLALFGEVMGDDLEPSRKSEALRRTILQLQGNLSAIEQCRKPVLAAIHSSCIGGGVDMVSCCDMRYCTEQAYFSIKEICIEDYEDARKRYHLLEDSKIQVYTQNWEYDPISCAII